MENFETLAKVAYYEASAAAVLIPNAWSMVAIMYGAQSNPAVLWDAADDWYEVKERLVAADKEVTAQLKTLTEDDWSGKDREAFEQTLQDYQNQIRVSYSFAVAVHVILKMVALLIAMLIAMMFSFATILALYAIAIIVAFVMAAIPGAQSYVAAVRAQATMVAGKLYEVLKGANTMLETVFNSCAATLAGMMAVDVVAQTVTGNTNAMPDFAESFVNSADDVAKGRLALMEQKLTAQLMGGKKIGGFGVGKWTLPTKNLPKDLRPYISPLVGIKGSGDVGTGSPLFTSRWTGGVEYGDDYVNRTNPLPATDS
jgi:hypothetical protein